MPSSQAVKKELEDLEMKVDNAREAAARPGAGERDKSDLKMIEQELVAAQNQAKHANHATRQEHKGDKLDSALKESFPGSDPVSIVEAGPAKYPKK